MVLFLLNFVSAVKCFIFEFLYKMNHFKLVHDTCLVNCAISMSMFTKTFVDNLNHYFVLGLSMFQFMFHHSKIYLLSLQLVWLIVFISLLQSFI